jgi:serine/threonine-protein kinase PRP4
VVASCYLYSIELVFFGNVLRVQDIHKENEFYAVKVARSHHEMNSAFSIEKEVLEKLGKIEKNYCVQLVDSFQFHKHNCLVLESMKECGRDLISRLGGVSLQACKIYGNQLLRALHYVHSIGAIHADVKPDNILIGENEAIVRLCDFGTALFDYQVSSITAEYGSLYYRAPEIILGYDVSTQVDVWGLACCLIELFTGEILFKGNSNNNMLELFMQLVGKFPKKLIKKSSFGASHFDLDRMKYNKKTWDSITGKLIVSQKPISTQPQRNLFRDILSPVAQNTAESRSSLLQFADVLMQMLHYDPQKRLTPAQALQHPFFAS